MSRSAPEAEDDIELAPQEAETDGAGVRGVQSRVMRLPVRLSVCVGAKTLTVEELLNIAPGQPLTLDRRIDDPVEIFAGERLLARGALIEENGVLGVRLTEICHASADD